MKTIEQLNAEHAVAVEKLMLEHSISTHCPVVPHSVMVMGPKSAPWVSYKADSLRDALDIFNAFPSILNMEHRKGTFTSIMPASQYKARDLKSMEHLGDYCAQLQVNQGDTYGVSAQLSFYTTIGERVVFVHVDFITYSIGSRYSANICCERDSRTQRLISRSYRPNHALNGYADHVISYASGDTGPIKKSADIRYLFVADDGETCTDFNHFLTTADQIADEFEGAK